MEETKVVIDYEEKKKQKNVRLYPKYKMFSWDMLFYYAIIFLFFTQVKGISAADVLLAESFYPLFKVMILIPATMLIEKIGKKKSLVIGNLCITASTLTYLLAINFQMILLGEFLSAAGFIIKSMCESNILYDSLKKNKNRGAIFSKIDGRANSLYYYIDAVSAVLSGFLFAINGYIPMIICLIINILSMLVSLQFEEIEDVSNKKAVKISGEFKEIKNSLKSIFHSPRLRNLLLFGAVFSGTLSVLVTLRSSLLSDIQVPAQYFGIIFAICGIISGISAKNQHKFHKKFRNRTLKSLALPVVVSCIFLGLWCNLGLNHITTLTVTIIVFIIQYIARGPFYTLIIQYMNNFTTSSLRTKISLSYNMLESLLRSGISFFASFLLRYTTTANTLVIVGCILTVIIVLMLENMKTKVGLEPEEYKEKDIKILNLK